MAVSTQPLSLVDPDLWGIIQDETKRQENHIELIASENYVSRAVLEAQGSVLTNKYAEGYPHKRYYGGCHYVDQAEELAIARAKTLFSADYVNVQPHSGSQANTAAYMALLSPGETLMGMNLAHGGHLTHGCKVNFSGQLYHAVSYGLNAETREIDYDEMLHVAREHRPKLLIGGFSAYSLRVDWAKMRQIADEVGAYLLVDMAHVAGLVATGHYPSPLPYADVVTTTTHKTLRGPRGGMILAKANPALEKKLNAAVFPGSQGGPLMHVIAGKAVAFKEALDPSFITYQSQVLKNAQAMSQVMMQRGYDVVSGRTENHLFLVSLIGRPYTGKEAEKWLDNVHITLNKNSIPDDPRSPFETSGLRIGMPAVTTRGMKEPEVRQLATWICDLLDTPADLALHDNIKEKVLALCQRFPVYEDAY